MIYLANGDTLTVSNPGLLATKSHVSFADAVGTTFAGGRLNVSAATASITALSGPASGTRNVRHWAVTNEGILAGTYTLNHVAGGVSAPLGAWVLQPGQTLAYNDGAGFVTSSRVSTIATLTLPDTQSPATPPTDFGTIFMRKVAGRMMAAQVGPSGLDTTLQANLGGNKCAIWMPPGGSTTVPGVFGMAALTATGTATTRAVATTNLLTRMTRLGYVSAATAGSLAGAREAVSKYTTGAGPGLGGFFARYRFGVSDAATVAGARMFVGLDALTTAPTNVEPSAKINCIGVAQLSSSANLHIVFGNATVKTPIDLGADFPANSTADAYELALFSPPEGGVHWRVSRLNTAFVASGFIGSTDCPIATTLLCHQLWRTNNATALAVAIDICGIYIETDH